MQITGKSVCPICAGESAVAAIGCEQCGYQLRSVRLAFSQAQPNAALYRIVPDGDGFAIEFRGEIKVDGLEKSDLGKARTVLSILNSVIEDLDDAV